MRKNTADDVWRRIRRGVGCWLWTGTKLNGGYGQARFQGRAAQAHRVVWTIVYGPIPKGMFVCHHCDNRLCCRPDHLFLGTQKDNIGDAVAKGRMASGDRNGTKTHPESRPRGDRHWMRTHAKLSRLRAEKIRLLYAKGVISQKQLAKKFGIGQMQISRVVRRECWS